MEKTNIHSTYVLYIGWAKQDLWGLGAESKCIVASFPFSKMILLLGDHFAPRPQRSCFANPSVLPAGLSKQRLARPDHTYNKDKKVAYFFSKQIW